MWWCFTTLHSIARPMAPVALAARSLQTCGHWTPVAPSRTSTAGRRFPLLEEVFDAFGGKTFINVELKNYATPRDPLAERVCELVKKCGLEQRVLLSSFLPSSLARARQLLPEVPRALLAARHWMGAWSRSFGFAFGDYVALQPCVTDVDARQVQRVHRLKRRIHVWTVNNADDMTRLKAWGVDGIFTNDPALAARTLGRRA